jgi:FkbH-like protein
MTNPFNYPLEPFLLLRKKKSLRRELLTQPGLVEKRVAILGGSTTAEVKDMLELFLLKDGIQPLFYESEYNRFYEDVMFDSDGLKAFAPELIYLHTSTVNVTRWPALADTEEQVEALLADEYGRFEAVWDRLAADFGCPVIQNNFDLPSFRVLGNMDAYDVHGRVRFTAALNARVAEYARGHKNFHLNDLHYLSAWFGLERWHDKFFWYSYKYAMAYEAIPFVADSVASIIRAIAGKTRKALVLDLDNTMWGGVIGDDGLQGIQIGKETAEAEGFTAFQNYVKLLQQRGVILAVCSKNDEKNAREGFTHPDSVLKNSDFSSFKANWDPKHENIRAIARELNIGIDSLVFADDNPAEREIVRSQEAHVGVPELGNNVAKYIDIIDRSGYFETVSLSNDDLQRAAFYADNSARAEVQSKFENYDDFLASLNMTAEILPFSPVYLDRIAQLTNKTNQFNVTTRRYTLGEIEDIANNGAEYVTLYGRLVDKFGDNGLISVVLAKVVGDTLDLDLWLMSCRVLKRGMEGAMLDQLVAAARARGLGTITGTYIPSAKNEMVKSLYADMGFSCTGTDDGGTTRWRFAIPSDYINRNKFIEVNK